MHECVVDMHMVWGVGLVPTEPYLFINCEKQHISHLSIVLHYEAASKATYRGAYLSTHCAMRQVSQASSTKHHESVEDSSP